MSSDRFQRIERLFPDAADLGGKDEYSGKARGRDGRTWIQNATGRGLGSDD